jgi:aminoglycoside 6'-N-acetyltransferase I
VTSVRPVPPGDGAAWLHLRRALWPVGSEAEHTHQIAAFLGGRSDDPLAVLVAVDATHGVLGFVELPIRHQAEGCSTDHVAYLEGWYVVPQLRCQGIGTALVRAAEAWARTQGCTEFASDAARANDVSAAAHAAVGFAQVGEIRCFRKAL